MLYLTHSPQEYVPWNKGKLIGQKPPLRLKEVWAIRTRLQMAHKIRDLAMFNLAIDSKLRSSRFNSSSLLRPGRRCPPGYSRPV